MKNPIEIFQENWNVAKASNDSNANYCTLATLSDQGKISTRTLVLRDVVDDSFVIFFDSTSPKWEQLENSDNLELLVFWPSMMQQYRIRGEYSEIEPKTMMHHWSKKPYDSKLLDHYRTEYAAQSSVLGSRQELLSNIQALKARYPNSEDIPFPDNAKGILIRATYIEVWHGSESDLLHDRTLYRFLGGQWQCETLVP